MDETSFHFMKLHFWGLFIKLPHGVGEINLHFLFLLSILPSVFMTAEYDHLMHFNLPR